MNPLIGKIVIAAAILILFAIIAHTLISLINKNERLREREKRAIEAAVEATRKVNLLQEGDSIYLDQKERLMLLSALEYVPFREAVEIPETKHSVRQVYRRTREKLQILIRAYPIPDKMDIIPDPPEAKEDDETKEVPK